VDDFLSVLEGFLSVDEGFLSVDGLDEDGFLSVDEDGFDEDGFLSVDEDGFLSVVEDLPDFVLDVTLFSVGLASGFLSVAGLCEVEGFLSVELDGFFSVLSRGDEVFLVASSVLDRGFLSAVFDVPVFDPGFLGAEDVFLPSPEWLLLEDLLEPEDLDFFFSGVSLGAEATGDGKGFGGASTLAGASSELVELEESDST